MADTKDFLIRLPVPLGEAIKMDCQTKGRSQTAFFTIAVELYFSGAKPSATSLIDGLEAALVSAGAEYQQELLDDIQERELLARLEAIQARKKK